MKVTGLIGIEASNANWNADWTKKPRTLKNGTIFASGEAFKYSVRAVWDEQKERVLSWKTYKTTEGNQTPRTLEERYCQMFLGEDVAIGKGATTIECATNLFSCIDVKNFGSCFAISNQNMSITGAVQVGDAINRFENTEIEMKQILAQYRNPKNKIEKSDDGEYTETEKKNATSGEKYFTDEAHYVYPIAVNGNKLKSWVEDGITTEYSEADFEKFKQASLVCATAVASSAKMGCRNEFGLFIHTSDNTYLPPIDDCVTIEHEKGMGMKQITINVNAILEPIKKQITKIELYYNPLNTEITTDITLPIEYSNIVTGTKIKK